ncbi:MAG: PQQ-binding-like beta-propeller repeat protein [Gemmataceae bacterium]|nr:PQQ-binding-like beta-propeller repeat protein [Gemmataceae bacterium]
MRACRHGFILILWFAATTVHAADWLQFRGPGGQGVSDERGLPLEWSAAKNVVWKTPLPGPGTSSPIVVGKRVYLTCYSGYGQDAKEPGEMKDLKRHFVCVDRLTGKILWTKVFDPILPEHEYAGEGSYHGYAASTPASDGERLYVFFGKSGVFCFDLDGKQLWRQTVGKGISGWGSGASPVLYQDLLIVNASVESGSLVALDKLTGKEIWKASKISSAWNTPVFVTLPSPLGEGGKRGVELIVSVEPRIVGLSPDSGKELWHADGVHRYVCPSVVAHDGVVYAIGGGHTSLAVKAGGAGDVTKTHELWRGKKGSNVSSPIYHDGHLYWASDNGGIVHCQEAATGKFVYSERLDPPAGLIYASPVLVDGKLYYVSQKNGTYVVAAQPKFAQLAHNVIDGDNSRTNGSLAVADGQFFLRSDRALYCLAQTTAPPKSIELWPDGAPGEKGDFGAERDTTKPKDRLVAGKRVIRLGNVSRPTISIFRPAAAKDTGAAVLVCPGGGYNILALDLEGTEVCEWLNSIGVTGVLLKYRVPRRAGLEKHAAPLQDAQRALGMLRQQAPVLGVDPKRIGVLGFSAGGHLAAALSTNHAGRTYPAKDDADLASCRPDFAILIYPGYLTVKEQNDKIAPELAIDKNTPPTFIVMTQDDPVRAENAILYALALKRAGVPAELHLYPVGGHGYGLRRTDQAVTTWPDRAADWLRGSGWLKKR